MWEKNVLVVYTKLLNIAKLKVLPNYKQTYDNYRMSHV